MKLREWMTKKGITQRGLSDAIGVTEVMINRWINRRGYPSLISVLKIEKFTKGEVTKTDLMSPRDLEIWNQLVDPKI